MTVQLPVLANGEDVRALVDNQESVDASASIEEASGQFNTHDHDFAAVCDRGRVIGLCSRTQISGLLSGRYGWALHRRATMGEHAFACLSFASDTPLRRILESALSRQGERFYHDVVLTDAEGAFIGAISTRRLVTEQSALIRRQFDLVASQRDELERANVSLTESLSHRRELERHIIQREKAALLDTLAGGIAHEINNKLMPIVAYGEMLIAEIGKSDDALLRDYARSLLDAAMESSSIIAQLLQMSRPAPTEWELCDLRTIIDQSLTLVGPRLKGTSTRLTVTSPHDTALVCANPLQLKQLVINLVLNAIDAVEESASQDVAIVLTLSDELATVSIADTGKGIAPEHLPRIFDPFFTTKAPNRGTGLGLGVCQSIVLQHGAEITVDSVVGGGSRFSFSLPRFVDGGEMELAEQVLISDLPSNEDDRAVLVVEDDRAVAAVVGQILHRLFGCRVQYACDGEAGVRSLLAGSYDAILCDVRMPKMNGLELVDWIKQNRPSILPSIILMTGDAGTTLTEHIAGVGIDVIRKPFTADVLEAALKRRWISSSDRN